MTDTTYNLTRDEAETLAGTVGLNRAGREIVLGAYAEQHGLAGLVRLFVECIGMANSVIANSREALELFAIVEKGFGPYEAEKLNLPTLWGAANGAMLAMSVDASTACHGCAFRLGTLANQSPSTTSDADFCGHPGEPDFMCHEDLQDGQPTKACAGWAKLRRARRASAGAAP